MLSLQDWYINIDPFMQSSDSFNIMTQSNIDMYSLLTPLCQAMTPDDKVKAVSIFQHHDCTWVVECLFEMKTTIGVAMVGMSPIQLGV